MKNACIVIRDKEQSFSGDEFEPVVAALIDGGYAPDHVLLVADDDVHAFAQALTDYKNSSNNLFVIAPGGAAAELLLRVCEILQAAIPQGWVVEKQKKLIACLAGGARGARAGRARLRRVRRVSVPEPPFGRASHGRHLERGERKQA